MRKQSTIKHGFTLVEVLVTATIIALLASIGVTSYSTLTKQSRDAKRKADLQNIRSALEMYRSDNDYYPDTLSPIVPSGYLNKIPTDPQEPLKRYSYSPIGSPATTYSICAALETTTTAKSGCGDCGETCSYKLTPLGEE